IKQFIDGIENSKIGNYLPNFKLQNNKNTWISLSTFKEKYVLIDLWASWCGPCRMSFPTLNKLYKQFHKKGLEILSISIDQKKTDWNTALIKDKNPWHQVLDTENIAQTLFAMTAIPYYILLDPSGKIILKELGFNPTETSNIEKFLIENIK
ncbi:MAG: TlpA disulfide reductase family protein, partial [Sediminibacterium sp.]|nr:TlpA disulfide reductase family protein [Sediminibacterium sp.]